MLLGDVQSRVQQGLDAAVLQRRDEHHGCIGDLRKPCRHLAREVLHQRPLRLLGHVRRGAQVPLAHHEHLSLALVVRAAGDPLVLIGEPVVGIDEGQRHIAALDGAERAQHAVVLEGLLDPALPPDARSVDKDQMVAAPLVVRVYGVPRRPGLRINDGAPLAQDGVEER